MLFVVALRVVLRLEITDLDTNTSSADYIQLHSGDKATLEESLSSIQQTASSIRQAIEPGGWSRNMRLCGNCAEEKSLTAQQVSRRNEGTYP